MPQHGNAVEQVIRKWREVEMLSGQDRLCPRWPRPLVSTTKPVIDGVADLGSAEGSGATGRGAGVENTRLKGLAADMSHDRVNNRIQRTEDHRASQKPEPLETGLRFR